MASGIGASLGAMLATAFGLPPQLGAAGGNIAEDAIVGKKDKKPKLTIEGEENPPAEEDGGFDIMSTIASMFGGQGGQGGEENPYMAAINGMGGGGESSMPEEKQLNTARTQYAPPYLMGFPSAGRTGKAAAIKQALAATRGF